MPHFVYIKNNNSVSEDLEPSLQGRCMCVCICMECVCVGDRDHASLSSSSTGQVMMKSVDSKFSAAG